MFEVLTKTMKKTNLDVICTKNKVILSKKKQRKKVSTFSPHTLIWPPVISFLMAYDILRFVTLGFLVLIENIKNICI